ncbi:MAG: hypothetical protein AABY85_12535 [Gemmatimonadota bacterium]
MSKRAFLSPLVLMCSTALVFACGGDSGGVTGDATRPGRLLMEREGRGSARLVEAPARATWCESDSALVIVAVDRAWTGGLALRVEWPITAPRTFTVHRGLEGAGTAAAALRSMGDSVGPALLGVSGTVRVEAAAAATGRLDVMAEGADNSPVRVTGSFRAVPVTAGCNSTNPSR